METPSGPSAGTRRRSRASAPDATRERSQGARASVERDAQYDLLTAALLGVALGAGAAVLLGLGLRRPPRHPMRSAMRSSMQSGRKWAEKRGSALGTVPGAVRHQVEEYLETARDAIADTVEGELRDLRRAVRRRRKQLGV